MSAWENYALRMREIYDAAGRPSSRTMSEALPMSHSVANDAVSVRRLPSEEIVTQIAEYLEPGSSDELIPLLREAKAEFRVTRYAPLPPHAARVADAEDRVLLAELVDAVRGVEKHVERIAASLETR